MKSSARVISQGSGLPLSGKMLGIMIISCFGSFLMLCSSEAVPGLFRLTTFAFLRLITNSLFMCDDGFREIGKPLENVLCVALYVLCSIMQMQNTSMLCWP